MKTKSYWFVVIGSALVAVGAAGWAWRESRLARDVAAARAMAVRATAANEARQRALETRLARATGEAEVLNKALAAAADAAKAREKSAAPAPALAPDQTSDGSGVNGRWVRAIRSDPTVQALQVAAERWRLETLFAPLCKSLGLTSEQREKFYGNLMTREAKIADVQAAADAQDISDLDELVGRLTMQANRECEAAQRELLGEENYRGWQEFSGAWVAREMVAGLAKVATTVGAPLSQRQAEALVPLLRGRIPSSQTNVIAQIEELHFDRMEAQIRAVLTDEQFALFKTTEPRTRTAVTRFSMPMHELIDRARAADAAGAPAPKQPGG